MKELQDKTGLIDAVDRVLHQLLKDPKFRAKVKILINSLDPASAPKLVKTLMWEDTGIFLDLVASFPELLNAFFLGSKEMAIQMKKFPPPLLANFISQIINGLDGEALGLFLGSLILIYRQMKVVEDIPVQNSLSKFHRDVGKGLVRSCCPEGDEGYAVFLLSVLQPALRNSIRKLTEESRVEGSELNKLISGLSNEFAKSLKENPDFAANVCQPFLKPLLGEILE